MLLLDTNIILELLEQRRHYAQVVEALRRHEHQDTSAVTALTLSTAFYLVEGHQGAVVVAEQLLKSYQVLAVTAEDATWAFAHYKRRDFEDALQVAVGVREGCTLMTLDKELASKYQRFLPIELVR